MTRRCCVCRGTICRGTTCRGTICRGSLCRGTTCRGTLCRGAICRGGLCRGTICRGTIWGGPRDHMQGELPEPSGWCHTPQTQSQGQPWGLCGHPSCSQSSTPGGPPGPALLPQPGEPPVACSPGGQLKQPGRCSSLLYSIHLDYTLSNMCMHAKVAFHVWIEVQRGGESARLCAQPNPECLHVSDRC